MNDEHKETTQEVTASQFQKSENKSSTHAVTFVFIGIAMVATIIINFAINNYLSPNKTQQMQIVTLDRERLIFSASSEILSDKSLSTEKVAELTKKVALNMQKVIGNYQQNGYIVISSESVVGAPVSIDITTKVADQLGIKLVK